MIERIKQIAAQVAGEIATTRVGFVYDYDQTIYSVRVQFQPSGEITGWMPIGTHWVGNSFGMAIGPGIGDMVRVDHLEGDKQVAMMGERYFNDGATPLQVPSGECWFVHQTGTLVKLTNDGKLLLNGNLEIDATSPTINITATGAVNVTAGTAATVKAATASVTATVSASVISPSIILQNLGTALKKLCTDTFMTLYNGHTHNDPQGGISAVPNQQATIGTHTTNIVQAE